MNFILKKTMRFFIIVVVLIFAFGKISQLSANKKYYAKNGIYVGLTFPHNTIGGDFDGVSFLTDGYDVALLPKVESNIGWGILLGMRGSQFAIELSYLISSHDITWLGAKGEADYSMAIFNTKYYFQSDKPIQPFIQCGIIFLPLLVVKDGYYNYHDDYITDARYTSTFGLNLGGGLSFYLHPLISIFGEIIYRGIIFDEVQNPTIEDEDSFWLQTIEELDVSGFNFNIGITFTFNIKAWNYQTGS